MLHQQGNPVFFAHKVKNIIHVCACVDNHWFKTLLPADFRDLIIMQSGFAQKKQIFVSQFGDGDLLLFRSITIKIIDDCNGAYKKLTNS